MKGALLFIALFALSMLIIPMIALSYQPEPLVPRPVDASAPVLQSQPAAGTIPESPPAQSFPDLPEEPEPDETVDSGYGQTAVMGVSAFRVLDESTGEIHTVPVRDYVRGAVAAEMPASFHPEALKAQAVAAHTYALHNHLLQQRSPDPALKGADFSADPSDMKVYITEETARGFYGEKADEYWSNICAAADSVLELVLEYEDEPIVAAYHAISAGVTEDAAYLWAGSAPYLAAAESEGDLLAPGYETQESFSEERLWSAFTQEYPDIGFDGEPSDWLEVLDCSPSGYVTAIRVGDAELHGKDVRRVLELRSHNFEVKHSDGGFTFTVYGYGHGVGLSQYGAHFMARQGAGFDEILANYYAGAMLRRVELGDA